MDENCNELNKTPPAIRILLFYLLELPEKILRSMASNAYYPLDTNKWIPDTLSDSRSISRRDQPTSSDDFIN